MTGVETTLDIGRAPRVTYPIPQLNSRLTKPTKILLGSTPLDVTSFTWQLSPGPAAYGVSLTCFPVTSRNLERLGVGPHTLTVEAPSGTLGRQEIIIKNVYLRNEVPTDEANTTWRVLDRRAFLDYYKFTGRFNLRRKVNDKVGLDPQSQFAYSVETYRPYSAFESVDKDGNKILQPWTAMGAIRAVLEVADPDGIDSSTFASVADNKVPLESKEYFQERASVILPELCRLAEVTFFVTLDGKYKFIDRRTPAAQHRAWRAGGITRGALRMQRNHRFRPSKVVVYFKQENEKYATFIESEAEQSDVFTNKKSKDKFEEIARRAGIKIIKAGAQREENQGGNQGAIAKAAGNFLAAAQAQAQANAVLPKDEDDILLENVIQLPRDLEVVVPGLGKVEFNRGEWLRFDLAIAAWQLLDAQASSQPLVPITKANIRKYWFGNVFGRIYTFDRSFPTWVDPEKVERVQAVRASYRRIFRITKPYLDNIHEWRAERVSIVDPVTRTRALPFVSTQFCEVPNLRPPVKANPVARVAAVNVDDFGDVKQSPFIFSPSDNRDLGIFTVEPMKDLTDVVRERIRGQVDNIPRYDLNPDGSILWQHATLQTEFKLKVIITVEWGAPNNKEQLFPVVTDVSDQGGQGGTLEWATYVDTARVDVDGEVVNKDLMNSIVDFETRFVMFSHRDVGVGYVHFTGLRSEIEPEGNARGVSFVVENGFAHTMYDITEPYGQRPQGALMNPALRKFAFRVTEVR